LKPCWESSLVQTAKRLQPPDRPLRIAVVGMGHELRGDDAAGVAVVRSLNAAMARPVAGRLASQAAASHRGVEALAGVDLPLRASPAKASSPATLSAHSVFDIRHSAFLIVDAGPAPENVTGSLRRFRPDLVVLIDAAHMGEPPGAVRWLTWQDTDGLSASTHTLPPHILAQYLINELTCEVALIGIQPADTRIGQPLSPVVRAAVETVVQALMEKLPSDKCLAAA